METPAVCLGVLAALLMITATHGQGFKPGRCPSDFETFNSNSTNCPNDTCAIDQDCPGERLCCSNGCSMQCTPPQDDILPVKQTRKTILACEGTSITLDCPAGEVVRLTSAFWGRGRKEMCAGGDDSDDIVCSGYLAYDFLVDLCEGQQDCNVPVGIGYFGDPCRNQTTKYLSAEYYCEPPVYRGEVCEVSGKLTLTCPGTRRVSALGAFFGRESTEICPHSTRGQRTNCSLDTATQIFKLMCDGKKSCNLDAWTGHFGDPCSDTYKYLLVDYTCQECINAYGDDLQCDRWAMQGECVSNNNWMMDNCRKTCWKCDPTPPACDNAYFNDTACEEWVQQGNCYSDAAWMHTSCYKSCTGCDKLTDCSVDKWDRDFEKTDCQPWFNDGQCSQNMHYMFWDCTHSCFGCGNDSYIRCANKYFDETQCEIWAGDGECQENPGFMIPNCLKACLGCTQDPRCENVFPDSVCDDWEFDNQCNANPVFMHQYCWKSCIKCDGGSVCENRAADALCEKWTREGECDRNPNFMLTNCTKSCTRCAPVSEAVADCLNIHNETACEEFAFLGECASNPGWMIPNCEKSCNLCTDPIYQLTTVGGSPMPGPASNLTRAMTFILPGTFPQTTYLTHFMAFFVRPDPVYLQIWTANTDGTYLRKYNHKVVPSGFNTAQTVLAAACVLVGPGDHVGFTTFSGHASPIAVTPQTLDDVFSTTVYRRASAVNSFIRMVYPFQFSLSAGYDVNSPCFDN